MENRINNTFDGELEPVEKDGKWGFINRNGQWAIEPTFFLASKSEDGVAAVDTDNCWTLINSSGQYLREPDIENVTGGGEKYWAVVRQGIMALPDESCSVPRKFSLLGSKALILRSPKFPIRMSLLKRPKLALAWTIDLASELKVVIRTMPARLFPAAPWPASDRQFRILR